MTADLDFPRLDDTLTNGMADLVAAAVRANSQTVGRLSGLADEWPPDAVDLLGRLAPHTVPRWHFAMLNDTARNDAYATAIRAAVTPGAHVLDIGSGTGLLAMLAAQAGAGHVTTCEANPLLAEIARQTIARNGFADVVTVVPKLSSDLVVGHDLPRLADVVVSEIVDCGLVGEGLLPTVRHARTHLLAPGGTLLPSSARMHGFLVESDVVTGQNEVTTAAGFDVRLLNLLQTRGHRPVRLGTWPHEVLSDTVELAAFDLAVDGLGDGACEVTLPAVRRGVAHALVVWFEMDLGGGVVVRNDPATWTHWMQALVPLPVPVELVPGDTLSVDLRWVGDQLFVR